MYWERGYQPVVWSVVNAVALALLCFELAWPSVSRRAHLVLFALVALMPLPAMWTILDQAGHRGGPFVPFMGHKLLVLAIALLAPSARLGALLLAVVALAPFAQAYLAWTPQIRARMPALEPWQTGLISVVAAAVLWARRRYVRVLRAAARARAERAWHARVIRLAHAVSELTAVPFETVRSSIPLLGARHADLAPELDRMRRALQRLHRLSDALAPFSDAQHLAPERAPAAARTAERGARREARRALLYMSIATAAGSLVAIWLCGWNALPTWNWALATSVGLVGFGAAGLGRLPRTASLSLLAVQVCVVLAASWIAHDALAASGRPFAPFNITKALVFALALLVPSELWGGVLLMLTGLAAYLQYSLWAPAVASRIPDVEPAATLLCAVMGVALLSAQRRHARAMRELTRSAAVNSELQQLEDLTLRMRDLTNTPLQTLRLSGEVIRCQHADLTPIVDRVDAALAQLQQLNGALAPLGALEWRADHLSFDALAGVEHELQRLRAAS
jgi:hypothetical protein